MSVRDYEVDEILRDGGSIHIRAIRPDDKQRLVDHFQHLSSQSLYFRFLGTKKELSQPELVRFTEPDFDIHVGLVATLGEGAEERIIGVGRYFRTGKTEKNDHAEVAFAVRDDHQGRGIGTLLLEHLAQIARAQAIVEFEAEVLGVNNRMLQMFRDSGFEVRRQLDAGVFHIVFPTAESEAHRQSSQARGRKAAAQSIRPLLQPRSVAVIGASRRPGTIGATLIANIKQCGFTGPIYPVNPHATEIAGLPAVATVAAIGKPVDLAVIAVPADAVEQTLRDCARAAVRGVVVISAGFGEISRQGATIQKRLTQLVRASGMRMIGPNCMGVLNADPAVALNATFAPHWPPAGNVAMLSQSGALGLAILDYTRQLNLGISSFVSVGNKADVSGNDLLCYWAEDPRTEVILLYLESFGNPRRFARIAPEVARRKPIVAVKSGRSSAGSRAASSHSAALANLDIGVDALFEQSGVIRTNTLTELFDVAALLACQPIPAGPRVGVVTNAGGPGILLADGCEAQGLQLPTLSEATLSALRPVLPPQAGLANPIDLIASATASDYGRAIPLVGNDPNVDALVVMHVPLQLDHLDEMAAAIAAAVGEVEAHKPVLVVFVSSRGAPPMLSQGPRGRLPTYPFPEDAALALAAAHRYSRWKSRARGEIFQLDATCREALRALIDSIVAKIEEPTWVQPADLAAILGTVGIALAASEQVAPAEAANAARRLGYPLVAKVVSPDVVHKTEIGGVIVGLQSATEVGQAVDSLVERARAHGVRLDGILLQREIADGVEALVGVTTDPVFGPLLVCGLGGVIVELTRDVSFHLTPLSDIDAAEMLDKLRSKPLLDGYRGAPPADREALIDVIRRVAALVEVAPELRELDLNPVKVLPPGQGAFVVDARMRLGPPLRTTDME